MPNEDTSTSASEAEEGKYPDEEAEEEEEVVVEVV
jgi:hypothetical protein